MPTCHFHPKSSSFFSNFSTDFRCVSNEKPRISIALKTIIEFLKKGAHNLDEVRMVLYQRENDRAYPVFVAALEQILAEQAAGSGA